MIVTRRRATVAVAVLTLLCLALMDLGSASADAGSAGRSAQPAPRFVSPRTGLPGGMTPTDSQLRRVAKLRPMTGLAAVPHLNYYGGPVVSNAAVVSVLWGASGSYLAQVTGSVSPNMDTFFRHVTDSSYLSWLSEYNTPAAGRHQSIGYGSFAGRTAITPSATASGTTIQDSTIQSELLGQITKGQLPAPTLDAAGLPNTVYALFFPAGTTICDTGSCSGVQFCAYHSSFTASIQGQARNVRYMVLPHPDANIVSGCGSATADTAEKVLQSYTSHELVETITDPDVGLATTPGPPLAWYDLTNGEIADICVGLADGTVTGTDGVSYVVQQEWSNALNKCIVDKGAAAPAPAPTLDLRTDTPSLTVGRTVTLSGTVTRSGAPVAGQPIDLIAWRAPGNVEQRIGTSTTSVGGTFTVSDLPSTTTRYAVRVAGASSPSRVVVVRPRLTAGLSRSVVHRNRLVYVRGSVKPGASSQRVSLQRRAGAGWVSVRKAVVTSSYRFGLRATRAGRYRYRVVAAANAGRASATSGTLRLRVLPG